MSRENVLRHGLSRYLTASELAKLQDVTIGIAGLGGLGSNACMMLARTGVEHFFLADYDRVESSNLNRQYYLPSDVGERKTVAMERVLLALNPEIQLETYTEELSASTIPTILPRCRIWIEALDKAETKALFVNLCLAHQRIVVSASGISGFGGPLLTRRDIGRLTAVGDFKTDIAEAPPLAPRVIWASAMLADAVLEHVLRG